MSVHTKKCHIKGEVIKLRSEDGRVFEVPQKEIVRLERYLITPVSSDEAFSDLNEKYSNAGAILKALRLRENMNQTTFGKLFGIVQGDLSKMENGSLQLGRERARKIADHFGIDYRILM